MHLTLMDIFRIIFILICLKEESFIYPLMLVEKEKKMSFCISERKLEKAKYLWRQPIFKHTLRIFFIEYPLCCKSENKFIF